MDIFGAKSLLILQALDYRYVILTSKIYNNETGLNNIDSWDYKFSFRIRIFKVSNLKNDSNKPFPV